MPYAADGPVSAALLTTLVRAAQHGDQHAIDALLAYIRPHLIECYTARVSVATAEDMAQIVLARLAQVLPRIDPDRANRFIVTVILNILRNTQRQLAVETRRFAPVELADLVREPTTPQDTVEYRELVEAVARAIDTELPLQLRDIVLDLLDGWTITDIAARRGMNPVTVRTRLFRARTLLADALCTYLEPNWHRPQRPVRRRAKRTREREHGMAGTKGCGSTSRARSTGRG